MMADGSDGTGVSPESDSAAAGGEIWGTLEELLLACAVTRHGTASWDSVATEVQTRSPLSARPGLTPESCRLRFRDLHRRFSAAGGSGGEGEEAEEREEDPEASAAEGWVGELRRLRVAELRRDVERCDLSIGTLQSKVKRLREERERSVSGEAKPDEVSGNDRLSGDEPGRSCRESNSTDLKPPTNPGGKGVKDEEVAKQEASGESSAAASKESSDLRSSASLCRRRPRKSGGTDEEEAASAPRRHAPQSSPPLAALLDSVAAKLGSLTEEKIHEHESQDGAAYRDTIRRHVDLEMVRSKLKASAGSRAGDDDHYPAPEFYRDLLLLCTNLVIFLPRSGPDHAAAAEARAFVSEHASAVLREPKQEHVAAPAPPVAAAGPAGADIVGPLIEKGKPLIVCRKRSSIAKAAAAMRKEEESAEKGEPDKEEEEVEDSEDEKKAVAAPATRDKAAWGMRTKKGRGGLKNVVRTKRGDDDAKTASDDAKTADKKGGLAKKRNAVDFLKRLNQGSTPGRKRGSPVGTTRRRSAAAATPEQEPKKTRKRGAGRMEGTGRGGSKRGGRGGGTKRGVGRPQKRAPAPITPPPAKRAKTSRSEKPPTTSKRGGRRQVG